MRVLTEAGLERSLVIQGEQVGHRQGVEHPAMGRAHGALQHQRAVRQGISVLSDEPLHHEDHQHDGQRPGNQLQRAHAGAPRGRLHNQREDVQHRARAQHARKPLEALQALAVHNLLRHSACTSPP